MNDTIFAQLMELRKHPQCPNMFDAKAVFELALSLDFYELADFIFMDTKSYSAFILTGNREGE